MSTAADLAGEDFHREHMDAAVNEYLDICAQIEKDSARRQELGIWLAARLGHGERYEIMDGVGVQLTAPRRTFSPELAGQLFSPEQLAEISTSAPSAALAKARYPVIAEACRVTSGTATLRRL